MYCRFCGYEITEEDVYCPNCGKRCLSPLADSPRAEMQPEKKKRSKWGIVVAAVLILAVIAGCVAALFIPGLLTPENATVTLTSIPADASVFAGDTYVGKAPLTFEILPDVPTDISVEMGGYVTWVESVTLTPGEHYSLYVTLEKEAPPLVSDTEETFERLYEWEYNGYTFSTQLSLSKEKYGYYQSIGHSNLNLIKYATDSYNRKVVWEIASGIKQQGDSLGFTNYETMMMAASFVQELPYVTDKESLGELEYVRYPIETLVDGVGDCEDKSILLASLLRELGCEVVILEFPNHAAVGVEAERDDAYGSYANYGGKKYFYLEATVSGWDLGEIPTEYDLKRISKITRVS